MIQLNQPYTDVYGNTHNSAVLSLNYCNQTTNKYTGLVRLFNDSVETYQTEETNYNSINCSFCLFTSMEAYTDGRFPMALKDSQGMDMFTIQSEIPILAENLQAFCEQWAIDNIIFPT